MIMLFNGNKTKVMYFKGRFCKSVKVVIKVSGQYVNISKNSCTHGTYHLLRKQK